MGIGAGLFRFHRAVISPGRRGPILGFARGGLRLAAGAYGLGVKVRGALYRIRWIRPRRAGTPVISVGNITAGGTGKTPLVAWLARLMVIRKMRPAILSRGYGRHHGLDVDDENLTLSRLGPDVSVVIDPDRVRGAEVAIREHGADVLILDDGFQHRRIERDLDIVLIDALWPFGAGHLLPRGLLREPLGALRRAGFLLVTRANLVGADRLQAIKDRLGKLAPGIPLACCGMTVRGLRPLGSADAEALPPAALGQGRWAAFCGIGNPEGFQATLRKAGCEPAILSVFSDHEKYGRRQAEALLGEAARAGCDRIATTEKDAVKIERLIAEPATPPVYALDMDLDFMEGSEALIAAILEAVGKST